MKFFRQNYLKIYDDKNNMELCKMILKFFYIITIWKLISNFKSNIYNIFIVFTQITNILYILCNTIIL